MGSDEAAECAAWEPDVVLLGPFGKHDSLGQYPPPPDGARYDDPATFTEEEYKSELKGIVEWAQGLGASPNPPAHSHPSTACQGLPQPRCELAGAVRCR